MKTLEAPYTSGVIKTVGVGIRDYSTILFLILIVDSVFLEEDSISSKQIFYSALLCTALPTGYRIYKNKHNRKEIRKVFIQLLQRFEEQELPEKLLEELTKLQETISDEDITAIYSMIKKAAQAS